MDWNDMTVEDKDFIHKFVCDRSIFYYREYEMATEDIISEGEGGETRNRVYIANCKMTAWANDRIRFNYFLGVGHENIGYEYKSSSLLSQGDEGYPFDIWNPQYNEPEVTTATTYHYMSDPSFHNYFSFDFKDSLQGLTLRSLMFNSGNATDSEVYFGWSFPTPFIWDQYWYNPGNTLMFFGVPYQIGESSYGTITIGALPLATINRDEIGVINDSGGSAMQMTTAECIYSRTNE